VTLASEPFAAAVVWIAIVAVVGVGNVDVLVDVVVRNGGKNGEEAGAGEFDNLAAYIGENHFHIPKLPKHTGAIRLKLLTD
jgi:hypothetical protein